ncbi:MAG: adenosylcobinamide-phosphate synthase CbiB [Hyphomicrobiaceae bacterium]|nr:adenosylcobinamide-phosphate synthase CbiB [Hyphomicrobiaceae bacterium]
MQISLLLLSLALAIEASVGYPQAIYQRLGHPVTWIGALIGWLEARGNVPSLPNATRRRNGVLALLVLLAICGGVAWLIQVALLQASWAGFILLAVLASSLIAQRSLHDHVARVATGLEDGLAAGREAVSHIVGRNPAWLDEAGVARAAIESLAENFADGVVAPAFWLGAGGLPGGVLYKAINTADSMIGHKTDRYLHFGWAAARLDDLVNLPASRLAALWIVLAAAITPSASARGAMRCVLRDAGKHRSPNAGWPEAATAGALGLKLNGPRVYGETRIDDAYMGDGRVDATAADIGAALALYRRACLIQWLAVAALLGLIASIG